MVDCLGLDKSKYINSARDIKDLVINEEEFKRNINKIVLMYARKQVEIKCEFCGNLLKLYRIDESLDVLKESLYCENCDSELGNMKKLRNNFQFYLKKILSSYFEGNKKCSKCKDVTRLFLKKR